MSILGQRSTCYLVLEFFLKVVPGTKCRQEKNFWSENKVFGPMEISKKKFF
jgi:hypothetical protein